MAARRGSLPTKSSASFGITVFCGLDNPGAIRSGNPATAKQVIVAHNRGRVLPLGTMRAIIEGSGIAPAEWFL